MFKNIFNYRDCQNSAPGHGNYCSQRCWVLAERVSELPRGSSKALSTLTHIREKVQSLSLPLKERASASFTLSSRFAASPASQLAFLTQSKLGTARKGARQHGKCYGNGMLGQARGCSCPGTGKREVFKQVPGEPRAGIPCMAPAGSRP